MRRGMRGNRQGTDQHQSWPPGQPWADDRCMRPPGLPREGGTYTDRGHGPMMGQDSIESGVQLRCPAR
eukprot:4176037-Pyramimonas_sp.AAC.1